jgi:hypothetical protein
VILSKMLGIPSMAWRVRTNQPYQSEVLSGMQTKVASRAAAVIVGLEAVGLIVIVVRELLSLLSGDAASAPSGIALLVLTAVGAAAVAAFALALWRGRSWGRSGSIVVQLLILAVALGAATGAYAEPILGLAIAAPAAIALILLILGARRAASDPDSEDASSD